MNNKRAYSYLFVALLLGVNIIIVWYKLHSGDAEVIERNDQPSSQRPVASPVIDEVDKRIAEHVAILRKENCRESIERLVSVNFYYWPGSRIPDTLELESIAQIEPATDLWTTDRILSNRRFLKVYQTAVDKSCPESLDHLRGILETTFEHYQKQYQQYYSNFKTILAQSSDVESVAFPGEDYGDPLKTPLVSGERLQLLAAMLILSQFEDQNSHDDILQICQAAGRQHRELSQDEKIPLAYRFEFLLNASIYHRQILATALLLTAGQEQRERLGYEKTRNTRWQEIRVVDYDAAATPYDLHARDGLKEIDYPESGRTIKIIKPITSDEFQRIFSGLKQSE